MRSEERLNRVVVSPHTTVGAALKVMDESGDRIVLVADAERVLLGLITDGDVRRFILAARSLDEPVTAAMNDHPVTLSAHSTPEDAREVMVSRRIECVPLLDGAGRLTDAVWWLDLFETPESEPEHVGLPVVVMAGGAGTRLSPYTNILPKPLMPIGERTILELIMDRFGAHGCGPFYLSVNYKAELIRAYLADVDVPWQVEYVHETRPLGTAGSLSLLRDRISTTFFLTNCDIVVDADYADILKHHRESGNRITLVASMRHFAVPYGVCETAEGGALVRITEKPQFDFLVSTGFYVIESDVLADIEDDAFVHVTDIINGYLERGERVGVYPVSARSWVDIGEMDSLHDSLERLGQG